MTSRYMPSIEVSGEQAILIRRELKCPPTVKEIEIVQRAMKNRLPRRKPVPLLYGPNEHEAYDEAAAAIERRD